MRRLQRKSDTSIARCRAIELKANIHDGVFIFVTAFATDAFRAIVIYIYSFIAGVHDHDISEKTLALPFRLIAFK